MNRQSAAYLAILFGRFAPIAVLFWYGAPMLAVALMLVSDVVMVATAVRSGSGNITPA